MPNVALAFDVNETLLDLSSLDGHFERIFGNAALRPTWFALMLQVSFAGIATRRYVDFPSAQRAAFEMLARRTGIDFYPDDATQVVEAMNHLPAHPEVSDALHRLREAGFRMGTLTNSPQDVAQAQLRNAGLEDLFDQVVSADEVEMLKPAPEPYQRAADRLGTTLDRTRLVAAHWWDVDGAIAAGCSAAFVARPGAVLNPSTARPDVVGSDLVAVADEILARDV